MSSALGGEGFVLETKTLHMLRKHSAVELQLDHFLFLFYFETEFH